MKNTLLLLVLSFTFFLATSCNLKNVKVDEIKKIEQVDLDGKEYTSTYICPMHCAGSGSEEAGVCPVCEMDYVLNEDKAQGDDHEGHDHEGHDHDGDDHEGEDN